MAQEALSIENTSSLRRLTRTGLATIASAATLGGGLFTAFSIEGTQKADAYATGAAPAEIAGSALPLSQETAFKQCIPTAYTYRNANVAITDTWQIYGGDPFDPLLGNPATYKAELKKNKAQIMSGLHLKEAEFNALLAAQACDGVVQKGSTWEAGLSGGWFPESGFKPRDGVKVDYPTDVSAIIIEFDYNGYHYVFGDPNKCGNLLVKKFRIPQKPIPPTPQTITPQVVKEVVILRPDGTEEVVPYTSTGIFHFREEINGQSKNFTYNSTPQQMPINCKPGQHGFVVELKQPKGYKMAPGEVARKPFVCASGVQAVFKDLEIAPPNTTTTTTTTPTTTPEALCVSETVAVKEADTKMVLSVTSQFSGAQPKSVQYDVETENRQVISQTQPGGLTQSVEILQPGNYFIETVANGKPQGGNCIIPVTFGKIPSTTPETIPNTGKTTVPTNTAPIETTPTVTTPAGTTQPTP